MNVKITRVHPDAVIPSYGTSGAAGFDIPLVEELVVTAHGSTKTKTGLIFGIPKGYALFIYPRSSTFGKTGLQLANSVGVIDEDFCGPTDELILHFFNPTDNEVRIPKGTRLAQGVFAPVVQAQWEESIANGPSRGGFGTTG